MILNCGEIDGILNRVSFLKVMSKIYNPKYMAYREQWIYRNNYNGKMEYAFISKEELSDEDNIIYTIYRNDKKYIMSWDYTPTQKDINAKDWHIVSTKEFIG